MKKIILLLFLSLVGLSTQAQEPLKMKAKNKKVELKVAGNCDICKKRIEKAAYSVKGVKSAKWDANLGSIFMIIDESKCSVPDIAKAVAGVGHDTELAKAKDEAYNNLHSCCQYKRVK